MMTKVLTFRYMGRLLLYSIFLRKNIAHTSDRLGKARYVEVTHIIVNLAMIVVALDELRDIHRYIYFP